MSFTLHYKTIKMQCTGSVHKYRTLTFTLRPRHALHLNIIDAALMMPLRGLDRDYTLAYCVLLMEVRAILTFLIHTLHFIFGQI